MVKALEAFMLLVVRVERPGPVLLEPCFYLFSVWLSGETGVVSFYVYSWKSPKNSPLHAF
jgi:hypothetical protein